TFPEGFLRTRGVGHRVLIRSATLAPRHWLFRTKKCTDARPGKPASGHLSGTREIGSQESPVARLKLFQGFSLQRQAWAPPSRRCQALGLNEISRPGIECVKTVADVHFRLRHRLNDTKAARP